MAKTSNIRLFTADAPAVVLGSGVTKMSLYRILPVLSLALFLTGCGEAGRIFGFDREGPDEFTVVRRPPLSVPPDVSLRPPEDESTGTERNRSATQARGSLLASGTGSAPAGTAMPNGAATGSGQDGESAAGMPVAEIPAASDIPVRYYPYSRPSRGEAALAQRATAYYGTEPDIRQKVDAESTRLAMENDRFVDKLLFWKDPEPPGTPVDALAESRRLQENEALGKPANSGEAPVFERRKSGVIGLF